MNFSKGLKRISAVFFGLIGVLAAIGLVMNLDNMNGLGFAAAMAVAFVAYRLTCWIIEGFFGP